MLDKIHLPRIDAEGFDHFLDGPPLGRVAIEDLKMLRLDLGLNAAESGFE